MAEKEEKKEVGKGKGKGGVGWCERGRVSHEVREKNPESSTIQLIFIEHLLFSRHSSWCWKNNGGKSNHGVGCTRMQLLV